MNYSIIEDIILNLILIIFPILVYLVVVCYSNELKKKKQEIILNIALYTSLYLCLKYGVTNGNKIMLFCNIPIVVAYIKKQTYTGIILSLINIVYCYYTNDILPLIMILKYISYILLYTFALKKRLTSNNFILTVAVIQGFFLSFEYFFNNQSISINEFIIMLIIVYIYYFATFSALYIFKLVDKMELLNNTIKNLKKDKEIKEALFKLTHEIKNPLAVCKGYLDMINLDNKEKSTKYISIMKQEINRSLNIIKDFVEFNKIKVVKEEIDLNLLLDEVYDGFRILINSNNIDLRFKRDYEEIYLMGDYERIKQVIINLLKNSEESINEKGKIEIFTKCYKKYVEIVIEDNGKGMNEEELSNITKMFYTTKNNGTGLGVALSNEIIKAHNGELTYKSTKDKGTKAIIKLPYA